MFFQLQIRLFLHCQFSGQLRFLHLALAQLFLRLSQRLLLLGSFGDHFTSFDQLCLHVMQLGVEGTTLVVKDLFLLRFAVQKSLQFGPLLACGAHLVNQSLDVLLRLLHDAFFLFFDAHLHGLDLFFADAHSHFPDDFFFDDSLHDFFLCVVHHHLRAVGLDHHASLSGGQLVPQGLDLVLVLTKHRILRVLVDLGLVFDVLGTIGVSQGGNGFIEVIIRRAAVGAHHRFGVASETIL
mmetsp:Transcript_10882/g.19106  ORF Transcript_10882/g.19106 Transcript_10882/m.19106 type:complete len:238 (-) Transcript_10882:1007-1720(-)